MPLDPQREFKRWLEQAYSDLDDAEFNAGGRRYNLACFLAQQAAEKALKAYLYLQGNQVVWGHSVAELVDDARQYDSSFHQLRDKGAFLDRFYIPTRYPNGLPGGIPRDAFTSKDALEAVSTAREIADFVSGKGK
ncbi:HEPN domain-containing protein [Candidatus Solincola sp.]|nr:HEPN domain-containing protein [Actinomycetota bacterium]MDI7251427.1 HEPN domain-containing protein [Actinomycetota bacterium]